MRFYHSNLTLTLFLLVIDLRVSQIVLQLAAATATGVLLI